MDDKEVDAANKLLRLECEAKTKAAAMGINAILTPLNSAQRCEVVVRAFAPWPEYKISARWRLPKK